MLFFFLQVCSSLKLCCTYQVIDLLIIRKKRFADSCGQLTMQLAFCCKVYWVSNHLCSRWHYISSLEGYFAQCYTSFYFTCGSAKSGFVLLGRYRNGRLVCFTQRVYQQISQSRLHFNDMWIVDIQNSRCNLQHRCQSIVLFKLFLTYCMFLLSSYCQINGLMFVTESVVDS